jgi:hypothetical protein
MDYCFRCFMRQRRSREVDEDENPGLQRSDRTARHRGPHAPIPDSVVPDEGRIGDLYEADQFVDPLGRFPPIRGVKTRHTIHRGEKICRYPGEHIDIHEKNERCVAGVGGKITRAGTNEYDTKNLVFIDGNFPGNIAAMINSHCTSHNARLHQEEEDFPEPGTAAVNVFATSDIPSDDDVYINPCHKFDAALPSDIPTFRCLCQGRDAGGIPICEYEMT